jgi:hypothetical protein
VRDAGWRAVGDRRVFGRKVADIDALEAVTWAHHAAASGKTRSFWGGYG